MAEDYTGGDTGKDPPKRKSPTPAHEVHSNNGSAAHDEGTGDTNSGSAGHGASDVYEDRPVHHDHQDGAHRFTHRAACRSHRPTIDTRFRSGRASG